MRDRYIEELLDRYENRTADNYRIIGELIYYSFHDGEEYMSIEDIEDNERAHTSG